MLRFKQFLLEAPAPPNIKDLQDYVYKKEAQGNEETVLGLHGGLTDPTIGYGHSLQNLEASRAKFQKVLPNVNFDAVSSGKARITKDEAQALFDDDTQENVERLRKLVPDLDSMTPSAQKGLFSSMYRGVLGGSPGALKLINAGKYDEGADELLNHEEYKKAKRGELIKGRLLSGIVPRMEEESALIRGEAKRRQEQQTAPVSEPSPATKAISSQPVQTTPAQDSDYTIQSGDTLWKLTKGDSKKINQIVSANPGLDPNKIKPGQRIKMPN